MIAVDRLDRWLDAEFVGLNTELEEAYFAAGGPPPADRPDLLTLAETVLFDGAKLVDAVVAQDALPAADDDRYRLLGSVGGYLAACRRHRVGGADVFGPAWSLARRLGDGLGVAPRYVFAHQCLYGFRTFTALPDEHAFVLRNAVAALAYRRAAHALREVALAGVGSPAAGYLLAGARTALEDVLAEDRALAAELDVDRFFHNVRPYFMPYRVGDAEYRGTNGGDFAAINEIDLLLGLCAADDPFYRRVLDEKRPYLPPGDQAVLGTAAGRRPLLARFLDLAATGPLPDPARANAELFLAVCRAHAAATSFHHHRLVLPFLAAPARADETAPDDVTTSGPPLEAVLSWLSRLVDLRAGRVRSGDGGAAADLDRLRALAG
jgi:hypothetical protein